MDTSDIYYTITKKSEGLYKEKGSKFLAYLFPMQDIASFETEMEQIRALHPKSRHYCYAYKMGVKDVVFRTNDDGEPSGTAGKPIFGQIKSHQLTNVGIIVIRYFGGTKLGASGLIQAYKLSSKDAIDQNTVVQRYITNRVSLSCAFDKMGHALNVIKKLNLEIVEKKFEDRVDLTLSIRASHYDSLLLELKAKLLNVSLEQAQAMKTLEDYCIELVGSSID